MNIIFKTDILYRYYLIYASEIVVPFSRLFKMYSTPKNAADRKLSLKTI